MESELKIKLIKAKHPDGIRNNSYLFNMNNTEKEKVDRLCKKYNLSYRELFSQLIEKAE